MKRGTINHPKTAALANKLGIERWGAVGILESLWHFTSEYAKQGNIGRFSNDEIAAAVDWRGDSEKLIAALVSTRWIDECAQCRLRVHDWAQHCDDGVHTVLARAGLCFADGTAPNLTRLSLSDRRRLRRKLDARVHGEHIDAHAERAASGKKHSSPSLSPSPAQPAPLPKPSPSPATPAAVAVGPPVPANGNGVGKNGDAAGPGMGGKGLGLELQRQLRDLKLAENPDNCENDRLLLVQHKLAAAHVGAEAQKELARRRDITPQLVDRVLDDIRAGPPPGDVAAVLVHRLRNGGKPAKVKRSA